MKKFTLAFFVVMTTTGFLMAQPILRGNVFTSLKGKSVTLSYTDVSLSTPTILSVPTGGANQLFDYSNRLHSSSLDTRFMTPQTLSAIPEATHADLDVSDNISSTAALAYYDQLLKVDSFGVAVVGWRVQAAALSLTQTTGGASDSLVIKEQFTRFSAPIFIQRFPMTAGTVINSGANSQLEYSGAITVAAYGLNKTPFVRRLIQAQRDSVIGWGLLKRTNLLQGGIVVSDSVLMTRRTVTFRDSFFLNGSPAPQALLSALGATQGRVYATARTNTYKKARPFSIFTVFHNPTTNEVIYSSYEWAASVVSATREVLPEANWSFFPNPVSNQTINVRYSSTKPVKMMLVDMFGKIMQQSVLPENAQDAPVSVVLNSAIPCGTYILHLQNGEMQKTLKVAIVSGE